MVKTNMLHNINRTLKIIMDDGREVIGKLLVYDQHMNVVLADTTERRPQTRKMKAEGIIPKRQLGLILLRGEHVVSVTVQSEDEHNTNKEGSSEHHDSGNARRYNVNARNKTFTEVKESTNNDRVNTNVSNEEMPKSTKRQRTDEQEQDE